MTESVFNTAYGIWNSLVSLAMTLFTTSPTAANSSVYSTCRLMYNAIIDISLPIAIVFFLIAICKDVVSSPPDQQVRKFFGDGLKFCVLIGILANLWDVMGYIMQIADGVTDKLSSNGSATYLMSNTEKVNGAAAIIDPNNMDLARSYMQDDFYILPSSVHEVLLVKQNQMSVEELEDMVKTVNASAVALQDRLSDHVYKYDFARHEIYRADQEQQRQAELNAEQARTHATGR